MRQKSGCLNHLNERIFQVQTSSCMGGSMISRIGVHKYKGVGVRFDDFI